jgi:hypothetical protein
VESEAVRESMSETEATKPKNFFSRLQGVYFSPGETFREIGCSPRVLIPIIVLMIISALVGLYLSKNLDLQSMATAQLERMVEQGRMTEEQMERQLSVVSRFAWVQLIGGAAFGSLAFSLIIAGFGRLFSILLGAENRFKTIFSVTIYAMIAISIVQSALLVLVVYLKGPGETTVTNMNSIVASNLGAVLASVLGEDALPKFLMRLARYADVFAIWLIVLLAIGYSAVSRKLKTATAATWLGVVYGIVALIGAAIGSFLG